MIKYFLPYGIIFISLHLLSRDEGGKQEKHCDTVLLSKSAKFHEEGPSIYAFACMCMLFVSAYLSGVRYVPQDPVSSKVFADTR